MIAHVHAHPHTNSPESHSHWHRHEGGPPESHSHDHDEVTVERNTRAMPPATQRPESTTAATGQTGGASFAELLTRERQIDIALIVLTGLAALLYSLEVLPLAALLMATGLGTFPLLKTGVLDLIQERKIGTEIFVTVAVSVAIAGGEYVAGAVVLTIILIAELTAGLTTDRARASIRALVGIVPSVATLRAVGAESSVAVSDLQPGDVVLVRAGERIPVDGTVVGGQASVNEAAITGESLPQEKGPGASVLTGTVVELGALDIRTEQAGKDTLFARIIELVEGAEEQRAPVQKLADRVAAWLIPVVFIFLIGTFIVTNDVRLIMTLLIFTSPAELGLATPLVVIAGIARAARRGILLKGGAYLEELAKVDVVVFDKTGTLTYGQPEVVSAETYDPAVPDRELIRIAVGLNRRSSHPLATAMTNHARSLGIDLPEPTEFEVVPGRGVTGVVEGRKVLVGNAALLAEHGILSPRSDGDESQSTVFVSWDRRIKGVLHFADEVRPGTREALQRLRTEGVHRVMMLTGDNKATAQRIADELGVDELEADLLPEDKLTIIRRLQQEGHKVAMVGDGINDAPALAAADVGIAMGAAGTHAALEAADVALMTDDMSRIAEARRISAMAYRTIKENLIVGVGVVHVLGIAASLMGLIGPIEAAIIHLGPDTLVFLNSMKLLRVRI